MKCSRRCSYRTLPCVVFLSYMLYWYSIDILPFLFSCSSGVALLYSYLTSFLNDWIAFFWACGTSVLLPHVVLVSCAQ